MGQIRTARVADVPQIVELLREGLPADLLPYTIFGCSGIGAFLEDAVRKPGVPVGGGFMVSSSGDQVAAFAEIRCTGEGLFLNQIFVRDDYQKRGVGSRLLLEAIERNRRAEDSVIGLDVMAENRVARRWYESIGFVALQERVWRVRSLADVEAGVDRSWSADGLPDADRSHAVFGFSEFSLTTPSGTYRVGRLGENLFRTTDAKLWLDRSAWTALGTIDPRRDLLGVFHAHPAGKFDVAGSQVKGLSIRMSASVDEVLGGLADSIGG